jgi:hypothetical protein
VARYVFGMTTDEIRTRGLLCARCQYDLSATSFDGVCPECAHPARLSWNQMQERLLRQLHTFRRWFSTVTTCTLILAILSVASGVSSLVVAGLLVFVAREWGGWMANAVASSVAGCASGLVGILWVVGWLVLARARVTEPWPELKPKGARVAIALASLIIVSVVIMLIAARLSTERHVAFLVHAALALLSFWVYATILGYCATLGATLRPAIALPRSLSWLNLSVLVVTSVTAVIEIEDPFAQPSATPSASFSEMLLPTSPLAAAAQAVAVLTLALFTLILARAMRRMADVIPTTVLDHRKARGYEPEGDSVRLPDST